MINLYVGTPGSGKSFHAVKDLYDALWNKKTVVTNFELSFNRWPKLKRNRYFYIPDEELTPQRLIDIAIAGFKPGKENQGLIIIDEASILFNCRDFTREGRAAWVRFFAQHRKFGWDIILITQFDRAIDRQIRSLVEYIHVHRRFDNMGFWGAPFRFLRIPVFAIIVYWYQNRYKCKTYFAFLDKRIASLYNSWNTHDAVKNIVTWADGDGVLCGAPSPSVQDDEQQIDEGGNESDQVAS